MKSPKRVHFLEKNQSIILAAWRYESLMKKISAFVFMVIAKNVASSNAIKPHKDFIRNANANLKAQWEPILAHSSFRCALRHRFLGRKRQEVHHLCDC